MQFRTKATVADSGFSLLEIMVAMGILAVASYFLISLLQTSLKGSTQNNVTVQAEMIKRNLVNNFTNDPSWINTVNSNPSLACLLPLYAGTPGGSTCAPGSISNIVVMDGAGLFYDSTVSANNGFDANGVMCPGGFNSAAGNDKCPFRVDITVNLICPAGGCGDPQIRIIGKMTYNPANPAFKKVTFNPDKYGFDFIRSQEASSLQASCDMLNGIYDSGPPPKCTIATVPQSTVIAVDAASCPDGYSPFGPAAGRVIMGAGSNGTTTYSVGDSGGSDTHILSLAEMPSHTHGVGAVARDVGFSAGGGRGAFVTGGPMRMSGATGGGQPFDNRQPYYALLYCQKN